MMIGYHQTLHFDISRNAFSSRLQESKKAKISVLISHTVFNRFEWNLVYCSDLLVW